MGIPTIHDTLLRPFYAWRIGDLINTLFVLGIGYLLVGLGTWSRSILQAWWEQRSRSRLYGGMK